mgnify:CR=1 FL=1
MPIDVSIIIVNWNARDVLRGCLRSIEEQTHASREVIIVDNASHDGSADMVRAEFSNFTLIANSTNKGFAAANNQGIEIATGRYILLLNPDTIVLDHAIDKMIAWCDAHPQVGCASCQIMTTEVDIQKTCFSDPSPLNTFLVESGLHRLLPRSRFFGRPEYSYWDRTSEKEVDVISGMFMMIPRAVIQTVGLLDEDFFIYAEEADLCRRIRKTGLSCVYAPFCRILHLDGGGKSTSQIKPQMHVQLQKSLLIYIRKHDGRFAHAIAKAIFIGSSVARWTVFQLVARGTGNPEHKARARLARAALAFHVLGSGSPS